MGWEDFAVASLRGGCRSVVHGAVVAAPKGARERREPLQRDNAKEQENSLKVTPLVGEHHPVSVRAAIVAPLGSRGCCRRARASTDG